MKRQAGFTLIELVLVVAILGVLAMAALPKLFNVQLTSAKNAARDAVVGAVQTGVVMKGAELVAAGSALAFPATIDGLTPAGGAVAAGMATKDNPLFGAVIATPVTANWAKVSDTCYAYDLDASGAANAGDYFYVYDSAATAGTFTYKGIAAACL